MYVKVFRQLILWNRQLILAEMEAVDLMEG
jgi:hypothetical protein